MGVSLRPRVVLTWPEKFVRDSVGCLQYLFYKPTSSVVGLFQDLQNMRELHSENKQLRILAACYSRDKIKYNQMEQEIQRLKVALRFTEEQIKEHNYIYKVAHVVSIDKNPYNKMINIDIGEKAGVKPDMCVRSKEGLVGVVTKVTPFISTVKLLTSMDARSPTSNAISATVSGKDHCFGIVEDYDETTNTFLMTRIKEDDPIKVGDVVISSGSGGHFPKYMEIGKVRSIEISKFGKTRVAKIDPFASFMDWKELYVAMVTTVDKL